LAMPEAATPRQAQTPHRRTGNLAELPAGARNRGQYPAGSENSFGEGAAAGEPENPDASTSAANSFLLAGGVGDVATPGEGRGGRRGMRGGGMGFSGGPGGGVGGGSGSPFGGGPGGGGGAGGGF